MVGQELFWRQDGEHERQHKRSDCHQGRDDDRFEDAPAPFPALDEGLDEYCPAREEHRICDAKVIGSCVLHDEQDENAHVDDAHHAVGFAAPAEQVEVEAREPNRQVEEVHSQELEEEKLERRVTMLSDGIAHKLDRRPTIQSSFSVRKMFDYFFNLKYFLNDCNKF